MIKVLILICSVTLAPQDCKIDTATAVINGPDAPDRMACGFNGQAYYAGTVMAAKHDDEYVKVTCQHTTIGTTVG